MDTIVFKNFISSVVKNLEFHAEFHEEHDVRTALYKVSEALEDGLKHIGEELTIED